MSWIPTLALSVSLLSIVVSSALTLTLWKIGHSVRRFERLEDTRKADVEAVERRLHATHEKLIDERFSKMTHDLNGHVNAFKLTLDLLTQRLSDGEQGLGKLVDVDHAMEIKTLNRMEQIKDYVRDTCASKADVREHEKSVTAKFDRLGEKVERLNVAVAQVGKKVEDCA